MGNRFALICVAVVIVTSLKAQVGFNNPSPDPSSILDLTATDKGLLIPRMTTAERQAIGSPGQSLLVFDTTEGRFYFYNSGWFVLNDWVKTDGSNNVSLTGNATVNGTISATNYGLNANGNGPIPAGGIIMWSGSIASIPTGWALCDGGNGTPDLRNRFIVGAGATYNPGNTGGEDRVTLNATQLPSHQHTGITSLGGSHVHDYRDTYHAEAVRTGVSPTNGGVQFWSSNFMGSGASDQDNDWLYYVNRQTTSGGLHTHTFTTDVTGGNQSFENKPLFFSLAYIMKL
ncbi:MAG: hypothetical protein RIF39_09420 [Cyclobacteriaceae bacterium]